MAGEEGEEEEKRLVGLRRSSLMASPQVITNYSPHAKLAIMLDILGAFYYSPRLGLVVLPGCPLHVLSNDQCYSAQANASLVITCHLLKQQARENLWESHPMGFWNKLQRISDDL